MQITKRTKEHVHLIGDTKEEYRAMLDYCRDNSYTIVTFGSPINPKDGLPDITLFEIIAEKIIEG